MLVEGAAVLVSIGVAPSGSSRVKSSSLDEAKGGSLEMYSLNPAKVSSAVRCPAVAANTARRKITDARCMEDIFIAQTSYASDTHSACRYEA